MGLPLGPRVELSKICGPSARVSRGGGGGCWALMATVTRVAITAAIVGDECLIDMRRIPRYQAPAFTTVISSEVYTFASPATTQALPPTGLPPECLPGHPPTLDAFAVGLASVC